MGKVTSSRIALHQIGHTTLCNAHASCQERLMHFGHTAVVAKTPLTDQGNHFQAEFAMWQRPAPFFFRSITLMKARTVGLDTLTYYQGQFPQTREHGDRAMAMIGHPQRLATLLTTLFQRGQRLFMRRFQARGSSSHDLSPVVLLCLLLLSDYTCCQVFFAIHPIACVRLHSRPRLQPPCLKRQATRRCHAGVPSL